MKMSASARWLVVIIILAFLLRASFLDDYFTGDAIDTVGPARNFVEAGRAAVYATPLNSTGLGYYIDDGLYFNFTHPPMRVALYAFWSLLLGFASLPLLPIILGILSIVFIYLIARELYSWKTAVIAAALAAVLRYHVYASVIGFGDNFLMLAVSASLYFFLKYLRTSRLLFAAPALAFLAASFLTKFSILSIVPVFFIAAYLFSRQGMKRNFLVVVLMLAASATVVFLSFPLTEYLTGVSVESVNFFDAYVKVLFAASHGSQPILYEKAFYIASYVWQLTPFFAALVLLSLAKLKRSPEYLFLLSWLAFSFLVGFASSGQDFQRFMLVALPPAIIIVAEYLSSISFSRKSLYLAGISAAVVLAASILIGLNDMMYVYSPVVVAAFFLAALAILFVPLSADKRKLILLGASLGLSVFFLFGTSFLVSANSSAVSQLVSEVDERGYPYDELWTTRDVSLYLAPPGQPSFLRHPLLNESPESQGIGYFAFYSLYEENKIIALSAFCVDDPFFAVVNGRKVGLVCNMENFD